MNKFCLAYITTPAVKSAEQLARILVERKLAACVNILPNVSSIYRWEGNIQKDHEVILLAKTTMSLQERLCELVKDHHPYDCPCICFYSMDSGYPPYLQWLGEELLSNENDT